ncbi:hypothetical protein GCM10009682_09570 [Luedemannella flava]|uniref:Glycosyltransferase subfamily 4-like N-terminal domain-containing protein n=1 Tax=Luedemannella flava TaxID=349316 RepID=A0ABP4XTI1_9ACTN
MSRAPRVLYLSFYFPPSRASGIYRARATANFLAEAGWEVTAYAAPMSFLEGAIGSVDDDLMETVDPCVRVYRPGLNHFRWETDIRRFGRLRRVAPELAKSAYEFLHTRFFPEQYASWGLNALARALRQHARRRFDVVVATGNPFVSFAVAWLFNRLTGVPYVLDYRDAWTLNQFTDGPAFPPGHGAWRWEPRVLSRASAVVFVNEPQRAWHAQRYPAFADRMTVVLNGWDPDLFPAPVPTGAREADRPLRFGFLGTVTGVQPVAELLDAFGQARGHPELTDAQLHVHGYLGFFRKSPAQLRERLGLEEASTRDALHYHEPVSKTAVADVYADLDVLVFMAAGGRFVTSGKIFEYMATGRPIVSVHAPGIAAADVLDGYPLWFNPNGLDVATIADAMVAAGLAARELTPQQQARAQRHAERYARPVTLAPLERTLRSLARR